MKILLVDDSRVMRNIQKKYLEVNPGVQFLEAADGIEALSVLASSGPVDLALVDWNMPNMDGHTLVKKIRETDRKTLIVMCTTEAEKPRVLDALKAGVNNYLVKPFTAESLVEKVSQTLAKARAA
jgi:two-component system chemotaxis response regulator CheY